MQQEDVEDDEQDEGHVLIQSNIDERALKPTEYVPCYKGGRLGRL